MGQVVGRGVDNISETTSFEIVDFEQFAPIAIVDGCRHIFAPDVGLPCLAISTAIRSLYGTHHECRSVSVGSRNDSDTSFSRCGASQPDR